MDRISKEHRSWNMSRIPGADTQPEKAVRSVLHRLGYRFRLRSKVLPGRPDIVLHKWSTVVFVHGCFWHRHKGCRFAYSPKSREEFWRAKFEENVSRDQRTTRALRRAGWRVIVVWECQLKDLNGLARCLRQAIESPGAARRVAVRQCSIPRVADVCG